MIATIDEKDDYLDGIDLTMFIRTCQATGVLFYLGKADITSTIKNRLINETLQVEASFNELDEPPEVCKPHPAQFSNGYRHFIQVTRMKDKMVTGANGSISINKEISSIVPTQEEKTSVIRNTQEPKLNHQTEFIVPEGNQRAFHGKH